MHMKKYTYTLRSISDSYLPGLPGNGYGAKLSPGEIVCLHVLGLHGMQLDHRSRPGVAGQVRASAAIGLQGLWPRLDLE